MKPGEYGCLISHFRAMKKGVESGADYFVVMEDDAVIPVEMDIRALVNSAPENWEILQLHNSNPGLMEQLSENAAKGKYWVPWQKESSGTVMYVIKREAAKRIVSQFWENDVVDLSSCENDKAVADRLIYVNAKTYTITFPPIFTNVAQSGIYNNVLRQQQSNRAIKKMHLLKKKYFRPKK